MLCKSCKTIQTDVPKFRFTDVGSNLANPLLNNLHYVYNMQKEYVIQFYKTITKLLCNLSFAGQFIYLISIQMFICDADDERKLIIIGIFLSPRGTTLRKIIQLDPNSNSTCVFSLHIFIHVLNFNSKCQFVMEIMSRNWKLLKSKGHNSAENYLTGPKFEFNLRILVINPRTKFLLKISMNDRENEWKLYPEGRNDRRMEWQKDKRGHTICQGHFMAGA